MHRVLASWPNELIIDHNVGRTFRGSNLEPQLSIKCMFNGQARYVADGRREFTVDDAAYVILNQGNPYSFEKRSITPVETFCVFFPRGLVDAVFNDLTSDHISLLDEGVSHGTCNFNFLEHRRPHGDSVSRRMLKLRSDSAMSSLSDAVLEEQLLLLARDILATETMVAKKIAALPRVRHVARFEMFRHVQLSCDYLHAHLDKSLTVVQLAKVAAMSPFHFLRSFTAVVGRTPQAYLSEVRMQKARHLLSRTNLSVSDIARDVGFESLPSFSARFKRSFGQSPAVFRTASK